MSFSFIVDSDIHFTDNIKSGKEWHRDAIIKLIKTLIFPVKALIVTGDLTDNGYNGVTRNLCCWKAGGSERQLDNLINKYIDPISKYSNVYLCPGNHDLGDKTVRPVIKYIKKKHGNLHYGFIINDIRFLCCGIYPDSKVIKWLKTELKNYKKNKIIIYFHYNIEGEWSNWWKDTEKDAFYNSIIDYKDNILAIFVGHQHNSYNSIWNGIHVVSSAGNQIYVCTYKDDGAFIVEAYGQFGYT